MGGEDETIEEEVGNTDLQDDNDEEEEYDEQLLEEEDKPMDDYKRKLPENLDSQEEPKKKKRKKSEKCLVCGEKGHRKMDCPRLPEDRRKELQDLFTMKVERKGKGTGRKKTKKAPASGDCLPFESDAIAETGTNKDFLGGEVIEGDGAKVKKKGQR